MTRGRRAVLEPIVVATDATALPVDERVSVRFPGGRVGSFDPSGWNCPRLRRQLSAEIVWQCRPGGRIGAPGTLQTYASACRCFRTPATMRALPAPQTPRRSTESR